MGARTAKRAGTVISIALALGLPAVAQGAPGTITTVAGNGTAGSGGDGGAATAGQLMQPTDMAPTPDGGFLIADWGNHRIRKVSATGKITTVAGVGTACALYTDPCGDLGPATAAKLAGPYDAAPTPDGGFLIADYYLSRIRKVSATGVITTVAGSYGPPGYSGDNGLATSAQLKDPAGVAPLPGGGFLIADTDNNVVRKVSAGGIITTVAGTGVAGYNADGIQATAAMLHFPSSVAPTPDGGFLIADQFNHRIRAVSPAGQITTVAGTGTAGNGPLGPATQAKLDTPFDVEPTPDGSFLIADRNNNQIRRVTSTGTLSTIAGAGPAGSDGDGGSALFAHINFPHGMTPAPDGGFFIADTNGNKIRKVLGAAAPIPCGAGTFSVIQGTAHDDAQSGTALRDAVVGLGGSDNQTGLGAKDCLSGGDGADLQNGGGGKDLLLGGAGADQLTGGPAGDKVKGQAGSDQLTGAGGPDTLSGGGASDLLDGGPAADELKCGGGNLDIAVADRSDAVNRNCEFVKR